MMRSICRHSSLFFFIGGICLLSAVLPLSLTLSFLLSSFLHECGHLAAMRLQGIPIRAFRMHIGGAVLIAATESVSYPKEIVCAAAGPAVNALLASLFHNSALPHAKTFALCNLLLLCYNLLPLWGNDGTVILTAAAEQLGCGERIRPILSTVCHALTVMLWMFGAWVLWYGALSDPHGRSFGYGILFFFAAIRLWSGIDPSRPT